MPINLLRTFSPASAAPDDPEDWDSYLGVAKANFLWKDLREKPLVVVIGEAGIGKTSELQLEAQRLQSEGKPAFFIALNQLVDLESWNRALLDSYEQYERWRASDETGYFFLDAVDESRLRGQSDFEKALSVARSALHGFMARVRIVISSRPTDWSVQGVQTAVNTYLGKPIAAARSVPKEPPPGSDLGAAGATLAIAPLPPANILEPVVVSLDPLSIAEARKLADALNLQDAATFWAAVLDGSYTFMATRPLDLEWMVSLWNANRSLGTYRELIECNIENRLTEVNSSYLAAGATPSKDQLREGAEALAAAAEFAGRAFIATEYAPSVKADEVAPSSVLSGWTPTDVARLLASAVFDEASYGRVRFHHRTIRAYLAACWVSKQRRIGVSFHRLLTLFAASPFGTTVLMSPRRWALCWLAAIDVEAREWIAQHFPEMLVFDGDPEAWDAPCADRAFAAYVKRIETGLRTDWYNSESEFRRVAKRLSPGLVANLLGRTALPPRAMSALLAIAKYGGLTDCAAPVFAIYQNVAATPSERQRSLGVLATLATSEQRTVIQEDLCSGALRSNGVIAAALCAVDWQRLSVAQLVAVFEATEAEETYGGGPMARALKEDLLPSANAASAGRLLRAVVLSSPTVDGGQHLARYPASEQPDRAWLLDALPDCLERVLALLPRDHNEYPEDCRTAARRLEVLRDSGFADRGDVERIRALIAEHPGLRWQIALEIAQSEDLVCATSRLASGFDCLVNFDRADLPDLTMRAGDLSVSQKVRDVWFTVGLEVAFRRLRGRERTAVIAALVAGPDREVRERRAADQRHGYLENAKRLRKWQAERRVQQRERLAQEEARRLQFARDVAHLRDASQKGSLQWLIRYSYDRANDKSFTRVDYEVIARDFGQGVAEALAAGLKVAWASAGTPNPADYGDGTIPWEAITALAGLNALEGEGVDIAAFAEDDAVRAARLAVWELNGPPSWFEALVNAHEAAVSVALQPWIEQAAQRHDAQPLRGALEMALRCSTRVRAALLACLVPFVADGRIAQPETLKNVVKALRDGGLMAGNALADLCRRQLVASLSPAGAIGEIHWLRTWLNEDASSAWNWFERHVAGHAPIAEALVKEFAKMAGDCKWVKEPASAASIDLLVRLHRMLAAHQPPPGLTFDPVDAGYFDHVVTEFRANIQNFLVRSSGVEAHRALVQMMETESDLATKGGLAAKVVEHATLEASRASLFEPAALRELGRPFANEPKNEAQLLEQTLARLEEVRRGTEEGPFSDRKLFGPKMPETHLQTWLAARLSETTNRRFTVSREEEVDDDKKPDIQLGCPRGKVCVEIKPLYEGCGYSANTLTDTLRTQLVGQYLRGDNSASGILVLFRLDKKSWDIPGGARRQSFAALVDYLQQQADLIKAESPDVEALRVFGINCVAPS